MREGEEQRWGEGRKEVEVCLRALNYMHFSSSCNQSFSTSGKSKRISIEISFICLPSFSCFSHWWQLNVVDTPNTLEVFIGI